MRERVEVEELMAAVEADVTSKEPWDEMEIERDGDGMDRQWNG